MGHKTEKSRKLRQQNPARNSCQWSLAIENYLAHSEAKRQTMRASSLNKGAAQ